MANGDSIIFLNSNNDNFLQQDVALVNGCSGSKSIKPRYGCICFYIVI